MKKAFLIGCLFMAAFESFAAEKRMRKDEPQISLPKTASIKQMQECATATTTYQGETIVCYRCAETMDGPNGAQAKAHDCLMDAMMEFEP
ncbi:hypothetical protein IQ13_2036 [Lacibacter cauensis]|uniref:Uncharacterized protein n=1 Tax=Lacibacter cauensis TaxID=510947 RepID=A0A562SRN3_9BACT|nr:hypothetical protein [Lacibacter cauensis]TWI83917.1 hypothetical protein IQ13_2036 [Lacibacter cauensis]